MSRHCLIKALHQPLLLFTKMGNLIDNCFDYSAKFTQNVNIYLNCSRIINIRCRQCSLIPHAYYSFRHGHAILMLSYVSALLVCAKLMTFRHSKRDRIDGLVLSGVTTSIDIYLFYSKVTSLLSLYSSRVSTRQPYPG